MTLSVPNRPKDKELFRRRVEELTPVEEIIEFDPGDRFFLDLFLDKLQEIRGSVIVLIGTSIRNMYHATAFERIVREVRPDARVIIVE